MRRWQTDQDRAHWLLVRWAANVEADLGSEYPPAPMSPTVQGDVAELTRPETHCDRWTDHRLMQQAMLRLQQVDPRLRGVLWQQYVAGPFLESGIPDEPRLAEEMGWTIRHWREFRDAARKAFLDEFEGLTG